MRPKVLDLGCCGGGASAGYYRAGYDVVGVDIERSRNYPFEFIQADMLDFLDGDGALGFDLIHASPPCQRWSSLRHLPFLRDICLSYPDLITPLRPRLEATGALWVIENNLNAPLTGGWLCGTMFDLRLYRHRRFETNFYWLQPSHGKHWAVIGHGQGINYRRTRLGTPGWVGSYGHQNTREMVSLAMDIDWMTRDELSQALPPVYCEYMGLQAQRERGRELVCCKEHHLGRDTSSQSRHRMRWARRRAEG